MHAAEQLAGERSERVVADVIGDKRDAGDLQCRDPLCLARREAVGEVLVVAAPEFEGECGNAGVQQRGKLRGRLRRVGDQVGLDVIAGLGQRERPTVTVEDRSARRGLGQHLDLVALRDGAEVI